MKKLFLVCLAICLMLTNIFFISKDTEAATTLKFDSIDSLTPAAFDVVSACINKQIGGSLSSRSEFSPKKIDGKWYFTFSANKKTVYILCNAFAKATNGTNKNQLKSVNSAIGKAVSSRKNSNQYILFYSSTKRTDHNGDKNCFSWNISKYMVSGLYSTAGITYNIEKKEEIKVTFITQWRARSTVIKYAHGALEKGGVSCEVTPRIYTKINKTGTNKNYFSTALVRGKGKVPKSVNITDLIDVGTTTAKIVNDVRKLKISVSNLYKLYKQVDSLNKSNSVAHTGKTYSLSVGNKKALTAKASSPFKLCNKGDFYEIKIGLNEPISSKKPLTEISFELTVTK